MFAYPAHGVAGQVRFVENLHQGAAGARCMIWIPSSTDPVARSHSGSISTSSSERRARGLQD